MPRDIWISDTLGGSKKKLTTVVPGKVSIYACGVTTYDHYHIGHALQAIYFDVICRYLEFAGYTVCYVRNYTDVDDKIIARAEREGMSPAALAQKMIDSSEEDMQALGCRRPDFAPRVSLCIQDIIVMVSDLIAKGAAYATTEGDVYYRVRSKSDYGKLSRRKIEELRSGTRDIAVGNKEDELDFALWKADTTPDASWASPWGVGRPGWHIECSAMSRKHLGPIFDIHGGGRDLVFPHHENEIAQSESANGCDYARHWMHSGLLTIEKQKMSKSLGNHIGLKDFLKKWPAEALRIAFLQYHYSSNIDFDRNTFKNAHRKLYYFYSTIQTAAKFCEGFEPVKPVEPSSSAVDDFHRAMSDDFNTPQAFAVLHTLCKQINDRVNRKRNDPEKTAMLADLTALRLCANVLGLLQEDDPNYAHKLKTDFLPELGLVEGDISNWIIQRNEARQNRDFTRADTIRKELLSKGIELMDTPAGTDWKISYDEGSKT